MTRTLLALGAFAVAAIGVALWLYGETTLLAFYAVIVAVSAAAGAVAYFPAAFTGLFASLDNWRRYGRRSYRRIRALIRRARNGGQPVMPHRPDPDDVEAPVAGHAWLYFAVLVVVGYAFYHIGDSLLATTVVGVSLGKLIWILGVLYFAAGFKIVGPETLAGLQFLGIPTIVVTGFPVIILPGLFKVDEFSRMTIQMELPDEPENIFRNEDIQPVPPGMVPPIRIIFAQGAGGAGGIADPLDERNTAEVPVFVRFRIRHFWSFLVRIGSFQEARKQLHDSVVSELQTKLAHLTVAQANAQMDRINGDLDNMVREKTKNWGIELIDVRMKPIGLSHELNISIRQVAQSVADKKTAVNNADANAYTLTKEGEGQANAIKLKLDAETDALKKRADDLKVQGADVLGARVAEAMGTSPSSKIVVGVDGLMETAKKLAESFAKH